MKLRKYWEESVLEKLCKDQGVEVVDLFDFVRSGLRHNGDKKYVVLHELLLKMDLYKL